MKAHYLDLISEFRVIRRILCNYDLDGWSPRSLASGDRMDFSETENDSSSFALQTRNVHKFYGMGKNAYHVLRGLDMDAPYGTMWVVDLIVIEISVD